jgi:hypothetical protein
VEVGRERLLSTDHVASFDDVEDRVARLEVEAAAEVPPESPA